MRQPFPRPFFFVAAMAVALCARSGSAQTDCNANGVPDDEEVGWQLQSVLVAADGAADDEFGEAVDAHGDIVVAGAGWEDSTGTGSGAAYVFRRTGQTWTQEAKLVGSDTNAGDYFGYAVAVDTGTILVGAVSHDAVPPDSGAAYVFEFDGVAWTEQAKLVPPDLQANDQFGRSIALDGNLLVIGSPGVSPDCVYGTDSGAAYVFQREAGAWTFVQKLTASDAESEDEFGISVAISGNTIVVGAHQEGHSGPAVSWWDGRGAAYVFELNGAIWEETAKLRASNPETKWFGGAVATTSELVAVGAAGDRFGGISGAGAVYLFEKGPSGWHETVRLGASDAASWNFFGREVAMQGTTVVATASVDGPGGNSSTAAYVFTLTELGWVQEAKVFGTSAVPGASFGRVVLSDETLVFGDTKDNTNGTEAGAVRVLYGFRNDCNANGIPDDCDLADQTSADCDSDGIPDECQVDCNMNGINDRCDVDSLQSGDCDADGIPDECQGDCNANGVPDPCDLIAGTSLDCQSDAISDDCQLTGTFQDTSDRLWPIHSRNPQVHEISAPPLAAGDITFHFIASAELSGYDEFISVAINGTHVGDVFNFNAWDCPSTAATDTLIVPAAVFNAAVVGRNAVLRMTASAEVHPDICDLPYVIVTTTYVTLNDCNGNGVPDECDISSGESLDCQSNGTPDECEPDCNENGVADACDVSGGTSSDCQPNAVPDECDIASGASQDCTGNGVPDECEHDCNENAIADVCEVLSDPEKDCDGDGVVDECAFALTTHKLVAPDPAADDRFGDSLDASGDVLVVGATYATSSWKEAGFAHVYRLNGVRWEFEQTLLPADLDKYDSFGRAVAVHGSTIFVGAPYAVGTAYHSGVVYIYGYTGDAWEQISRLIPCDRESHDHFGYAIAANADLLVVGAQWADGSGDSAGVVYLYERVADEWVEGARLVSPQGLDNEYFGSAVAMFDDTIAVGSSSGAEPDQLGSVYLFRKIENEWTSVAQLVPPEGDNALRFGTVLDVGAGMVLVGAYGEDSMGSNAGAAYLYEYDGSAWTPTTKLVPAIQSPSAYFGISVSVTDDGRILIASRRTVNGDGECMANVYEYKDPNWLLSAQYVGSSAPAPYFYRCTVASLAQTVALGDTRDDEAGTNSGAVFLFTDYRNDCNNSGTIDSCDIADGTSQDGDEDGLPDECKYMPTRAPAPHDILKNRYISIDPNGESHHIRVMVDSTQVPNLIGTGPWWATAPVNAQPPSTATCISVLSATKPATAPDWTGCSTLHLTGCPIVPTTTYSIQAEVDGNLSVEVLFDTQAKPGPKWHGDCVGFFDGAVWTAPNGTTSIDDAVAAIKTFQNPSLVGPGCGTPPCNATHTSVTDVHPAGHPLQPWGTPNKQVDINDVFAIILGFQGWEFPGPAIENCP